MKRQLTLALALFIANLPAFATTCEESFEKKGNIIVRGTTYTASVTIPNINANRVIGQMRDIATAQGIRILRQESHILYLEQPTNAAHRSFPITVAINGDQVQMVVDLRTGSFSGASNMKNQMCGMLNQLRDGSPTR